MMEPKWQKSSFSGDSDDCVELSQSRDGILIRESDDPLALVTTGQHQLGALLLYARTSDLGHPIG
ncbi:DUF397 domain-containing protein [Streptomyces sp. I05A-00742]|uniref:DUF397 domain-containing protein n=1 Tax=Streptomyces sp. I05A-00742 TaxID=2732853 RepID=UPI001488CDA8|nr:DUF397 domain-containing protein [Streptomyces sp. I05A-00742]